MTKINVGIVGAAGYTGGELIRILINHQHASIAFMHSQSNAGKKLHEVHADLVGESDLQFNDGQMQFDMLDVLFLCLGHGESKKFLEANPIPGKLKVIDLAQDFRLLHHGHLPTINGQPVVYGLPELNKEKIRNASHIANPGCFATAIQLGLLPLAKAGLLGDLYSTGITGSTGAGQGLSPTSHFSWRANNIQAYKTLTHQHIKEIYQSLHQLQGTFPPSPATERTGTGGLNFVPWRGDFTRGIFVSTQMNSSLEEADLIELFEKYYSDHPFTTLSRETISLKQVVNTNKCIIQLEKIGNKLVIHSAIDNLLKGASGQAVQNMNLAFGLDEKEGLRLKANYF
ncbi:MAG: N-acetyl-gamma-glutamyl-phosphate reductase [Chitinophagales bacterium]